ncbi:MAG: 2-oxoacid:acceptor oxidoreductase family protein [Elusimicrobia bacterium]|nr:2-oxoacid:acceptor oxidoreductase family protein [Elusimicrobiota bacterium]
MSDERFRASEGIKAFTGNELLLKGGLEGGIALFTGYPGSPISDVFDSIYFNRDLFLEHGIVGQIANNEALAVARLNGCRMANLRAMAVMKSVGLHVASDAIAIGNLAEPKHPEGGALIVVGDDPWNETTQIVSDSRFLSQHLQAPILEPSTFQEIKDWISIGFELSGSCNLYVTFLITTPQADGGGSVVVKSNVYPKINSNWKMTLSNQELDIKDFVMIPPHTSQKEATLQGRTKKFIEKIREKNLNSLLYFDSQNLEFPLGFITSGMSYCYLEHALYEMDLKGFFPILKLGSTYPLDQELVRNFLQRVKTGIVIEEKRPFLENQIKVIAQGMAQESADSFSHEISIYGKEFPHACEGIPQVRGINTSILIDRLGKLFLALGIPQIKGKEKKIKEEIDLIQETSKLNLQIPVRTPTFCPGCPHRDSAIVSLKMKKEFSDPNSIKTKKSGPVDFVFHGESGCHSMLQFAPNEGLMQNYSGMGLGGGTGSGIDPFIKNKQVVFLGDSTFFHSGMIAISDSIKNNQNITYIILDNKTTAMTGHQPTPGNDFDILGRKTLRQKIERIVRALAGGENIPVIRANPEERESYSRLIENLALKEGVKVVIADKECAITFHRRMRKEKKSMVREKGYLPSQEFINITPDVCEACHECTQTTGCPGLTIEDTDFGPKVVTDLSTCVADGACMKGKVCPSFEKVVIIRKKSVRKPFNEIKVREIPLPSVSNFDSSYYISTFAVGGMGAGVISAILVRAGIEEGYSVLFQDKKGLAIRNGGVYGHVVYSKNSNQVLAPQAPYGKADLVLGIDLLETARGLDPKANMQVASPFRSSAIVNSHKTETILTLMRKDFFNGSEIEDQIKKRIKQEKFFCIDFSQISENVLGSKLYTNLLMVGAAYQKGELPLSLESLEKAIKETVGEEDLKENSQAFHLGREIVCNPEKFLNSIAKKRLTYDETIALKAEFLKKRIFIGEKLALKYRQSMERAIRWMHLDEVSNQKIALRFYELIQYENMGVAELYLSLLWEVYRKDHKDFIATKAAIENLFKVMAIKDEIYVSHLLTSQEKIDRDKLRYRVDESNGDEILYTHFNRPHFSLLGLEIEFDFHTKNWMLNIMKYCKFLRRLLPLWHKREKAFRNWYIDLVRGFNYFRDGQIYMKYVQILKIPETVSGYREIRYPKMEEARKKVFNLLSDIEFLKKQNPNTKFSFK